MKSDTSSARPPLAAWVGIHWADQKHHVALGTPETPGQLELRTLAQDPTALADWVHQLRQRFGPQARIGICLEQSRGALMHALMGYEGLELYPINPEQLASYRRALAPSGSKDDPVDAALLCEFLRLHRERLTAWQPDDALTRKLAALNEGRRKAVDERTRLCNELKSALKQYYPLALAVLDQEVSTALAADFLLQWPSFERLQQASRAQRRKFFYGHHARRADKWQAQLALIEHAPPLTRDPAIIEPAALAVQLLAHQLKALLPYLARYEEQIAQLFNSHPDAPLFKELPGAGPALGPRLLTAFGTQRSRFRDATQAATYFGLAPVTRRSGKSLTVRFRWACPKFLRQTFQEFAAHSVRACAWAAAYYQAGQRPPGGRARLGLQMDPHLISLLAKPSTL
jgi:transposase